MLEDTTIHNAITDKALASYFRSSGNLLEEESAVLGQAVTNLMLSHMFVVLHLPAFSQFPQLLFLLSESQASGILFRTSP
ncbi:hypothetical protein ACVWDG_05900, partial [Escherichia coli]